MPQRVAKGFQTIVKVAGVGGAIIGYLSYAPDKLGLGTTLHVFNAVLLACLLLFLWLLHLDLEAMKDDESASSDDDENVSTDGGIKLSPKLRELQEESPEGGGALGGLIAGGAVGVLGGPAGVVIGGIVGGVLGNEAEYQQIVDRYRKELGETAKNALRREPVDAPGHLTVENISHQSGDDTYTILIEDDLSNLHQIRLDLNEQSYFYEKA